MGFVRDRVRLFLYVARASQEEQPPRDVVADVL